jgi:hypothetical protein
MAARPVAVPVVVGLAVVVPALVAPARKIETRKDRRSKGIVVPVVIVVLVVVAVPVAVAIVVGRLK